MKRLSLVFMLFVVAGTAYAVTPLPSGTLKKPPTQQTPPAPQVTPGTLPAAPAQQAPAMQNIPKVPVQVLPAPVIDIINATAPNSITVRWTWNANLPVAGFKVERKSGGGAFSEVSVTNAAARALVETTLNANTAYTYRVRAFQGSVNSPYSGEATATTPPARPKVSAAGVKKFLAAPGSVNILSTLEVTPSGMVDFGANLQFKATIPYAEVPGAPPGTSFPCKVTKIMAPAWTSEMEGFELPYPNNSTVINFTSTYPVTDQGQYAVKRGDRLCFRVMQDTVQVSNEACVTVKSALTPGMRENLRTLPSGQQGVTGDGKGQNEKEGSGFSRPGSERMFNPQPEPPGDFVPQGMGDGSVKGGFQAPGSEQMFNPQPEPPGNIKQFDPQPEPPGHEMKEQGTGISNPGSMRMFNPQPEPPGAPIAPQEQQIVK